MALSEPIRDTFKRGERYICQRDVLDWLRSGHTIAVNRQADAEADSVWEAEARGMRMAYSSILMALQDNLARNQES